MSLGRPWTLYISDAREGHFGALEDVWLTGSSLPQASLETQPDGGSRALATTLDIAAQSAYLKTAAGSGSVVNPPSIGQTVYLTLDYQVTGTSNAISFSVRAVLDGTTICDGPQTIGAGSWTTWCPNGWVATSGSHTLRWDLDYTNSVAETNENNNSVSETFTSMTTLDIAAQKAYLRTAAGSGSEINPPTIGQTVYLTLDYEVTGTSNTISFSARGLLDGTAICDGPQTIGQGSWTTWCPTGWVATAGSHTVRWDLDYNNAVAEANENNNSVSESFVSGGVDIAATTSYLRTASGGGGNVVGAPSVGQTVYLTLDYQVTGTSSAITFTSRAVLDGTTMCDGPQTTGQGSWTTSCPTGWVVTSGSHTLRWDLDYNNAVAETNESNNSATTTFLPTVVVDIAALKAYLKSAAGGGSEVNPPVVGQTVYLTLDYQVSGTSSAISFTARALLDGTDMCDGPQTIGQGSWTTWCPNGWVTTAGSHTLRWDLDYNNAVAETNENNNSVTDTFVPTGVDIAALKSYLKTAASGGGSEVDAPTIGQTLYLTLDYQVTGTNSAISLTSRAVLDGTTMCDGPQTIGQGSWTTSCPTGWVATAGSHTLRWDLDYNNAVAETNESNNSATTTFVATTTLDIAALKSYLRTAASGGGSEVDPPNVGQTAYLTLDYQVTGTSSTISFTSRAVLDGTIMCDGPQTVGQGSWTTSCPTGWVATAGSHTLEWNLDYNNAWAETNENNNSATKTFTPGPPAPTLDFQAQQASLRTAANGGTQVTSPVVGQTVFFTLAWQLTGSGSTVNVSQRAMLDGTAFCSCSTPATPGTAYTSSCGQGWTVTAGTHMLEWDLNYDNAVPETNTTNDAATLLFTPAAATSGITIATNPSGRQITVDGANYTAPQAFSWTVGSSHSIATASPQSGTAGTQYIFGLWSDGGAQTHNVTAPGSSTTYTASFTTQYLLTTMVSPSGAGSTNPNCSGAGCWYNSGFSVSLQASPAGGNSFSSWSGSVGSTSNPLSLTMSGPTNETANLVPATTSISVTTSPSGRQITVDGTSYTAPQTFSWTSGSSHTIGTSSPQSGATGTQFVLASWNDEGSQTHTVSPTSSTTYTATFTTQYQLTTAASPSGGGAVSPNCASGCWYNSGTNVSLQPTANGGYIFANWSGGASGSVNPLSLTMSGPTSVTANFATSASATAFSVAPTTATYGQSVGFTVAVTSNSAAVTAGTVTFTDTTTGATLTSNLALNSAGQASFSVSNLSAGNHTIQASYSGATGIAGSSGTATIAVSRATLTVTANSQTTTYPAAPPTFTVAITGFVNGDTPAVVSGAAVFANNAALTNGKPNAGSWTITPSAGTLSATNYSFASGTTYTPGTLTVNQATLTLTANSQAITYPAATPSFTATITGFVNSDTAAVVSGVASFGTNATLGNGKPNAGTWTITPSAGTLSATNYTFGFGTTYATGALTVSRASLTVTANNLSMVASTTVPVLTATITGLANNDIFSGTTNTFPSVNNGNALSGAVTGNLNLATSANSFSTVGGYPITAGSGGLGLSAANYAISFVPGTLTVTPVGQPALTISKTHTGTFSTGQTGATYTATVNNTGTGSTSGTVTVTENPPTGLTLVSMGGSGWTCPAAGNTCTRSDALNPGASYPAITVMVNVAANTNAGFTESFSNAPDYSNNWVALPVSGTPTVTYTPGNFRIQAPNTCPIPNTGVSASFLSKTAFVGDVDISIQMNHAGYGRSSIGLWSATQNQRVVGDDLDTDDTNYLNLAAGSSSTQYQYAGTPYMNRWITLRIQVSGSQVNFFADGTLLQAYAVPVSSPPDAYYIFFSAGSVCWKSGANDTSFRLVQATVPTSSQLTNSVSVSGGGSASNSAADVTTIVQASAASTTAFSTAPTTSTYGQFVSFIASVTSNSAAVTTGTVTFNDTTTGATLAAHVALNSSGQASLAVGTLVAGSHTIQASYNGATGILGSNASTSIAVSKATLTVTANNQAINYPSATPTFTASITGFLNGDTSTAVSGAAGFSANATLSNGKPNAGTWTIAPSAGTLSATNYTFGVGTTYTNGTLTVTKATLTVAASNVSMFVGTPVPTLTALISGLVNSDTISGSTDTFPVVNNGNSLSGAVIGVLSIATTASSSSPKGNYPITAGSGGLGLTAANYAISFTPGNLTVSDVAQTASVLSAAGGLGSPGSVVRVMLSLAVPTSYAIDALTFGVTVTPQNGAPNLTAPMGFSLDSSVGGSQLIASGNSPSVIGVFYQSSGPALTGSLHLGDVLVTIPAAATVGQTYTVHIYNTSAAVSSQSVALSAGADSTLTVAAVYLVGDVFPSTGDSAGTFGDGTLNTLDLLATLRAATGIPGFVPPTCSDLFDSMDLFPADTNARGGDGVINTLDLLALLRKVANTDTTRPVRASRGLSCSSMVPAAVAPAAVEAEIRNPEGLLEAVAEGARTSIYLRANSGLSLIGLSFSLGAEGSIHFMPGGLAPSLTDTELPGIVAVAWLEGLDLKAGDRILLGYLDTQATIHFFGVSANDHNGRAVTIKMPNRAAR